jgi:hypothetical protein
MIACTKIVIRNEPIPLNYGQEYACDFLIQIAINSPPSSDFLSSIVRNGSDSVVILCGLRQQGFEVQTFVHTFKCVMHTSHTRRASLAHSVV